jgi:hypothetical protein
MPDEQRGNVARRHVMVGVVVAVACWLGSTGTASAKSVPPGPWSATLCSALTNWQNTMQKDYDKLGNAISDDSDLTAVPGQVAGYVDELDALLADLQATVHRDGAPAVHNGPKIQAAFTSAVQQARTTLVALRQQAVSLPTDSSDSLTPALSNIDDALTKATDPVANTLDKINDLDTTSKLVSAFAKQKSCKSYTL